MKLQTVQKNSAVLEPRTGASFEDLRLRGQSQGLEAFEAKAKAKDLKNVSFEDVPRGPRDVLEGLHLRKLKLLFKIETQN